MSKIQCLQTYRHQGVENNCVDMNLKFNNYLENIQFSLEFAQRITWGYNGVKLH